MATVDYTIEQSGHGFEVVKWVLGNADTGVAYQYAGYFPDKSVHIAGTHGGATTVIEGSNFGKSESSPTFVILTDTTETALSFTTGLPALSAILQNVNQIRPATSGGTGTSVVVRILMSSIARG